MDKIVYLDLLKHYYTVVKEQQNVINCLSQCRQNKETGNIERSFVDISDEEGAIMEKHQVEMQTQFDFYKDRFIVSGGTQEEIKEIMLSINKKIDAKINNMAEEISVLIARSREEVGVDKTTVETPFRKYLTVKRIADEKVKIDIAKDAIGKDLKIALNTLLDNIKYISE